VFLAENAASVQIFVRRDGLAETMSRYLVDRIEGDPRITVRPRTQVTGVHGGEVLSAIDFADGGGNAGTEDCAGIFCFIGAAASTDWLPPEVRLDPAGFVLTDRDLQDDAAAPEAPDLLPFESSVPGVFAVGDVRHGSTKRVAAAVGEGASAIRSAHQYLAVREAAPARQPEPAR
jgi:thioredoxin reductase (NADPH)